MADLSCPHCQRTIYLAAVLTGQSVQVADDLQVSPYSPVGKLHGDALTHA